MSETLAKLGAVRRSVQALHDRVEEDADYHGYEVRNVLKDIGEALGLIEVVAGDELGLNREAAAIREQLRQEFSS